MLRPNERRALRRTVQKTRADVREWAIALRQAEDLPPGQERQYRLEVALNSLQIMSDRLLALGALEGDGSRDTPRGRHRLRRMGRGYRNAEQRR